MHIYYLTFVWQIGGIKVHEYSVSVTRFGQIIKVLTILGFF